MLETHEVTVAFGDQFALDGLDLSVAAGEILAVMGPSGSGKSTLLRVVAGLQSADSGWVSWDGEPIDAVPPHKRGFGLMFQDYALFPHKTVAGNVGFGLRMQDRSPREVRARTLEVLELVGLAGYGERSVGTLSGGEQQRVALARTLAPEPRLLLLDEPIGSLDLALREHLIVEMREIFEHLDVIVLYVTHDRGEAFAVADRVAVVRGGRIVRDGSPREIWSDPRSRFVASFLGMENVYPVEVDGGVVDAGWLRLDGPRSAIAIAIPPDAVSLDPEGSITGRVISVRFQAGSYRSTIGLDGETTLVMENREAPRPGTAVSLTIDATRVAFLDS
jgi:thiamine transport system ATP-binding protein